MNRITRHLTIGLGVLGFAAGAWVVPAAAQDSDNNGYVKPYGSPGDAGVFVNGKYVGPAHRFSLSEKYATAPGPVEITFKEPRYEDYTVKAMVTAHKTTKVKYKMTKLPTPKPPFGRLRLGGGEASSFMSVTEGDAGAVYLNNRFVGYVDQLNNPGGGLLINPGTYDLFIDSPTFGQVRQKVTITANKLTIVPLHQGS